MKKYFHIQQYLYMWLFSKSHNQPKQSLKTCWQPRKVNILLRKIRCCSIWMSGVFLLVAKINHYCLVHTPARFLIDTYFHLIFTLFVIPHWIFNKPNYIYDRIKVQFVSLGHEIRGIPLWRIQHSSTFKSIFLKKSSFPSQSYVCICLWRNELFSDNIIQLKRPLLFVIITLLFLIVSDNKSLSLSLVLLSDYCITYKLELHNH